jgi:hypothetical protein
MPSPFPGMDPYLESPERWSEVHNRLMVAIADDLSPKLRPRYRVAIEQRVYLSAEALVGIPDVTVTARTPTPRDSAIVTLTPIARPIAISLALPEEVRESYLEVREVSTGKVVTVVELLSPKNKRKGEGRTAYERKRQQVLASATHLVEIDLLRKGKPFPLGQVPLATQYYILIARGDCRPKADLYPFSLQETIPSFLLPLDNGPEPVVNLQAIFAGVYDRAGFDLVIDYQKPLAPKLNDSDGAWVEQILK